MCEFWSDFWALKPITMSQEPACHWYPLQIGLLRCPNRWCAAVLTSLLIVLQALRFVKALICLGVHFYMVQYFPVNALTTDWYYSLGIIKRYPRSALSLYICARSTAVVSRIRHQPSA